MLSVLKRLCELILFWAEQKSDDVQGDYGITRREKLDDQTEPYKLIRNFHQRFLKYHQENNFLKTSNYFNKIFQMRRYE